MSEVLTADINDLTVGEIETIESLIDAPIDAVGEKGFRKGTFLRAIAFVISQRTNPEFTWEDAANVRMSLSTVDAEGKGEGGNRAERRAQSRKRV
ncbi:MAG: hypothetical protein ABIQ18_35875 [Umezawaea sp.]